MDFYFFIVKREGLLAVSYFLFRAMENTLQMMNGRNETFRQSLKRADTSSKIVHHTH